MSKRYNEKRFTQYCNNLISLSNSAKIEYLSRFHGKTRNAIFKRLPSYLQIRYKDIFNTISKNKIKESQKASAKKRRNIIRKFLNLYKNNTPCKYCGENNCFKLSYHHIDKDTKLYPSKGMSTIVKKCSLDIAQQEVDKCIVLCHNCHHMFHYKGYKTSMINKYKKLQNRKKTKQEWKRMYRIRNKILVILYKETLNCIKCQDNRESVLIFHHIDYETKTNRISKLDSITAINKEMQKCVCLCRNCHEEYHHIYGKNFSNIKDLTLYLNFNPSPLIVDISKYKEQLEIELL